RAHPRTSLKIILVPMAVINLVFRPLTLLFGVLIKLSQKLFGLVEPVVSEVESSSAVDTPSGALDPGEREMMMSLVEFKDTLVREVMVPRVDMVWVDEESTLSEANEEVARRGHSRIPVARESVDEIVGLIHAKEMLKYLGKPNAEKVRVKDIMHDIDFVPETKSISQLLKEFQQKKTHMAIVVDEYGGTAGLVTIEDLLEEIVGEIRDEFDREPEPFVATDDGGYIIDAKMSISEIAERLDIELPEGSDYDTVGGYVVTVLGKVPRQGEVVKVNGFELTVLKADERKIDKIKLEVSSEQVSGDREGNVES
ncbi:MAG: HlyC/CorC family transporter, partial [Thermoplasmata archaeon]|nr:HlyC/CorC family transporter [Thermoplasmata archaeon]